MKLTAIILRIFRRLPVLIRSVVTGFIVAALGTTPWAILVSLNLKYVPNAPWSVPVTAVYLWLFWRYMQGDWWPKSTAKARKKYSRVNKLSDDVWGVAMVAGISGLIFIVLFQGVLSRLVRVPSRSTGDLSRVPIHSLFFFVAMSALVAGVAEEVGFRGYMQGPIEKRHGPAIAIFFVGLSFGLAHFTHPEVTITLLPYYIVVSAIYGALAYLTDSILPSLALHTVGNFFSSLSLLTNGSSHPNAGVTSPALIWETGTDTSFWAACFGALLVLILTIFAYRMLASIVRKHRGEKTTGINATVDL